MVMPDPDRSWACLIGVSTYPKDDGLGDFPAVPNNLDALHEILTDPLVGGLLDDHCVVIQDPTNAQELALQVEDIAIRATDMLFVYFAGHGLIDPNFDGRLYLATSHTLQHRPHFTSLAYDDLRRAMLSSGARRKVVVLDCCFSGLAHGFMSGGVAHVAGQLDIRGTCVLTATKNNELAKAPAGAAFTAYTGNLVDVLRSGVAGGPELIDIATLHEQLQLRLRSAGLPEPRVSSSDTIGRLSLVRNASWRPVGAEDPVDLTDPNEVYRMGSRLEENGRPDEAERLYRRSVSAGNTGAMLMLGSLCADRGDWARAERWYRESAEKGNATGMIALGAWLERQGKLREADSWYREAAEFDQPIAMEGIGRLAEKRGDVNEAERWYRKSAEAGRTGAMIALGALFDRRDDEIGATSWYLRAAGTGDAVGWTCLGLMSADRGRQSEADAWYYRAAAAGEPSAMINLGSQALERDERAEAIQWFRKAAEAGSDDGMVRLGDELQRAGNVDDAARWFLRASEQGNGRGMVAMGKLYEEAGDTAAAEDCYRRSIRAGFDQGVLALAGLLVTRGEWDEIEQLCRPLAEAGRIPAMTVLGLVLERRGRSDEAKYWQDQVRAAGSA
ncbi:tetratricopeptide repeat protein [Streptosporangium amethystogenes subsp. fukuiense]|uniref:Tetratricopeptide repeat protein n=1 Tax=Streptosporangium amethystogenes subsp. fukuiense TaxID=698418 RepID=A0ABW2TBF7_9ACTN